MAVLLKLSFLTELSSIPIFIKVGSCTGLLLTFFFALCWRDWLPLSAKKAVGDLGHFYLLQ